MKQSTKHLTPPPRHLLQALISSARAAAKYQCVHTSPAAPGPCAGWVQVCVRVHFLPKLLFVSIVQYAGNNTAASDECQTIVFEQQQLLHLNKYLFIAQCCLPPLPRDTHRGLDNSFRKGEVGMVHNDREGGGGRREINYIMYNDGGHGGI